MSFLSDLRILYHMVAKPVRGKDHAARLESFYSGQAAGYDDFRRRLLQGREAMYRSIPVPDGGVWVDLGGGTGANLEPIGGELHRAARSTWSISATRCWTWRGTRCAARGWTERRGRSCRRHALPPGGRLRRRGHVFLLADDDSRLVRGDRQRLAMLRPGGTIGVTDFFVARKYPADGRVRHAWFTRDLLARMVRLGQCLRLARSRALFAAALPDSAAGGAPGEGALHAAGPRAVLYVRREERRSMGIIGFYTQAACLDDILLVDDNKESLPWRPK